MFHSSCTHHSPNWRRCTVPTVCKAFAILSALYLGSVPPIHAAPPTSATQQAATTAASTSSAGRPLSPEAVAKLLPVSVYFQGKTAPLQLRNAAAVSFSDDATVWAALVDTSGYASDVQERYQFYLVTESPLLVGQTMLAAGAYGGGFIGDRFLIMDLGGHSVAEGDLQKDPAMKRPRPLQMMPDMPNAVKLYLGRHWVELQAAPHHP